MSSATMGIIVVDTCSTAAKDESDTSWAAVVAADVVVELLDDDVRHRSAALSSSVQPSQPNARHWPSMQKAALVSAIVVGSGPAQSVPSGNFAPHVL